MKACVTVSEPEAYLDSLADKLQAESSIVCLRFAHNQYYLPEEADIDLLALVGLSKVGVAWAVIDRWCPEKERQLLPCVDRQAAEDWAANAGLPFFDFTKAIPLQPISIPKPWGQEIWYTGIESRGQSCVGTPDAQIPLPWLLELLPSALCGNKERDINLLKILDPLSEPVYGDLYYEQHEEKQEVYVVTHVDSEAWPDGRGGISIGFDPVVRSEFESDDDCKAAFAGAVSAYESVRREIDALIDGYRGEQGVALNEPVMAEQLKLWQSRLPVALQEKEFHLRQVMDRFKGIKSLRVGDVLKVPCYTPHSLMHGVRTIEFQTPVYERQIISFAQKVLTQAHWDTQKALDSMNIDMPVDSGLPLVKKTDAILVEEVVDFDSFYVWRLTLVAGESFDLDGLVDYALVIGVEGSATVCGLNIEAEKAAFIPGCCDQENLVIRSGGEGAILLLSFPRGV